MAGAGWRVPNAAPHLGTVALLMSNSGVYFPIAAAAVPVLATAAGVAAAAEAFLSSLGVKSRERVRAWFESGRYAVETVGVPGSTVNTSHA